MLAITLTESPSEPYVARSSNNIPFFFFFFSPQILAHESKSGNAATRLATAARIPLSELGIVTFALGEGGRLKSGGLSPSVRAVRGASGPAGCEKATERPRRSN